MEVISVISNPRAKPYTHRGNMQTNKINVPIYVPNKWPIWKNLVCIAGPSETINIPFREDFFTPFTLSQYVDSIFACKEHANNT